MLAESTCHHFTDDNWDIRLGCLSLVEEPPGDLDQPEALDDIKGYGANIVRWLARSI